MKKILFLTACIGIFSAPLCANEQEIEVEECVPCIHGSYNYWTIGIGPLPVPAFNLGVGRRISTGENFAIDIGLQSAILIVANSVRFQLNGFRYFNQTPNSQYYFGLGGSVGTVFGTKMGSNGYYAAPNIIVGKEFINSENKKRFFQVEALYPLYNINDSDWYNFPVFTLSYGFSF